MATGLFWINMSALFGIIGVAIPKILNKMIKHDVDKDIQKQKSQIHSGQNSIILTQQRMKYFINQYKKVIPHDL